MGRFILRFETDDGPRYLEYSTIVDAPRTYGMPIEEFKSFYKEEYGLQGMLELDARLARVDLYGTSELPIDCHPDLESTILCNRAGADETCMTVDEMRDWYCVKRGKGKKPRGTASTDEIDV